MKARLIIAIILHLIVVFVLVHFGDWWLVFGVYTAITANNIEQSGRFYEELKRRK